MSDFNSLRLIEALLFASKEPVPVSVLFKTQPFPCKVLVRQWDPALFALVLKFFIKRYAKHLN